MAIAHNLRALAFSDPLQAATVNLRGTLLKLRINDSVANLFNTLEITGEAGHLIRQGTYLELLPTPIHNFKATSQWLKDEFFAHPQSASNPTGEPKTTLLVDGLSRCFQSIFYRF